MSNFMYGDTEDVLTIGISAINMPLFPKKEKLLILGSRLSLSIEFINAGHETGLKSGSSEYSPLNSENSEYSLCFGECL